MGVCVIIDKFPEDEEEFWHMACDGRNCDWPVHGPFHAVCGGAGCDDCGGTGHANG